MLPFEFRVEGSPVSQQAHNRALLRAWRGKVRAAAERRWPSGASAISAPLQIIVVHYHESLAATMDNDNLVKPIQDALEGLVYTDDIVITDTRVRKSDINGRFRLNGLSSVLAEGFIRGREFVYIRIEDAPSHEDLL